MPGKLTIRIKRVYEVPAKGDGFRVLVDRLWPRGVKKEDARLDAWEKDLAPSTELRHWFGHDPEKFDEFARRYKKELQGRKDQARALMDSVKKGPLTLVFGAKDERHNQAVVLKDWLEEIR